MLSRTLFASVILAACAPAIPPPSPWFNPGTAHPAAAPASTAGPGAAVVGSTPPTVAAAQGLLRIDGASTSCTSIVSVQPDGSAALLCTFERERACGIRQLGPDGEERSRSELVPGRCMQWVPRGDGGGFLLTLSEDDRSSTIAVLDNAGKLVVSTALTSKGGVAPTGARLALDGGLIVALQYNSNLVFRGKQLGTTKYTVAGIIKLPPSLDRLAWSKLFDTRLTMIAALLPATHGGVDAITNTRGPLVPGAPVNPPLNADGSFGGETYGWRSERVVFDAGGNPAARTDLAFPAAERPMTAVQVDDSVAALTPSTEHYGFANLTTLRPDGQRDRIALGNARRFEATTNGAPWIIDNDLKTAKQPIINWTAREIGGDHRKLALVTVLAKQRVNWVSIAAQGDRVVAFGNSSDPSTGIQTTVTALAALSNSASTLDPARLSVLDRIVLNPACRVARSALDSPAQPVNLTPFYPALGACGLPVDAHAYLELFSEGGIKALTIVRGANANANAKATACARQVLEPVFACPPPNRNIMLPLQPPAAPVPRQR
ncbi:hypothetical protein BH11MYX1_BH11MYX1_11640 [soil metagenome]